MHLGRVAMATSLRTPFLLFPSPDLRDLPQPQVSILMLQSDTRKYFQTCRRNPARILLNMDWKCYSTYQTQESKDSARSQELKDEEECELVSGLDILLGDGDDTFDAYVVKAIKNNNGAGILMLTDIYGYKDTENRDFAYRLACSGYNVLVPDMFRGNPWNKENQSDNYEQWRETHPLERIYKYIETSTRWLAQELAATSSADDDRNKIAIIGFCFGGGRALEIIAREEINTFATAVVFYGTRFDPDLGKKIKVPLLLVGGDEDPLSPPDNIRKLEELVEGSQVVVYKGRGHGFVHRPQTLEEDDDAEDAFTRARHWLHDHLIERKK